MIKYARDCNNDGVVDCVDYSLIHLFGGPGCSSKNFNDASYGREFYNRFSKCRLF